jgi:hypothetical protein
MMIRLFSVFYPSLTHFDVFNHKRARRSLFTFLSTTLKTLKSVYLYESVIQQYFYQLFYYMNCIVFNELMEHPERFSSTTHGFEIALALSTLLEWADRNVPGLPRDQLFQHILQAANVMVMDKTLLKDKEMLVQVWPALNPSHIYRIICFFRPDATMPDSVPDGTYLSLCHVPYTPSHSPKSIFCVCVFRSEEFPENAPRS